MSVIHALVVDDDEVVQRKHAKVLEDLGCKVTIASSAEEGLTILKDDPNVVDVIFSDLSMSGMSGYTFAEKAREVNSAIVFTIVTQFHEHEFKNSMRKPAVQSFFPKPLRKEDVKNLFDRYDLIPAHEPKPTCP